MMDRGLTAEQVKKMNPDDLMASISYTIGVWNAERLEKQIRETMAKHHPYVYSIIKRPGRTRRFLMRLFGIKIYYYEMHGFEPRFMLQVNVFGKPGKCHTFRA